MYDDSQFGRSPRTAYLLLGVFIAFMIYGMFNPAKANVLLMIALPYVILIGLMSSVVMSVLRIFVR